MTCKLYLNKPVTKQKLNRCFKGRLNTESISALKDRSLENFQTKAKRKKRQWDIQRFQSK